MRFALILLGGIAFALAGCENKPSEPTARDEEPFTPLEQTDTEAETAAATDWYTAEAREPAAASAPPDAFEPQTSNDEVLAATAGQTYVVHKGDTLYELARRFYNDQARWKDIWEANRTRLPDPDQLRVGMKLIIP